MPRELIAAAGALVLWSALTGWAYGPLDDLYRKIAREGWLG